MTPYDSTPAQVAGKEGEVRRRYQRIPIEGAFPPKLCGRCGAPLSRKLFARGGRPETPSAYLLRKSCRTPECSLRFHDGRRQHPLFWTWKDMIQRCTYERHHAYKGYGGRGIKVCDAWLADFWQFIADMGPRPDGCSIDRINNDGNYEPGNCRWATRAQQTRNSRVNKHDMLPPEAPPLREFAPRLGITRQGAWHRIRRLGWKEVWNGAGATKRHPLPPDFKEQP